MIFKSKNDNLGEHVQGGSLFGPPRAPEAGRHNVESTGTSDWDEECSGPSPSDSVPSSEEALEKQDITRQMSAIRYFLPMPVITEVHITKKIEKAKKICETSPKSKECYAAWYDVWDLTEEHRNQKGQKETIDKITRLLKDI